MVVVVVVVMNTAWNTTLSMNDVAIQRWQARFVVEIGRRNFLPSMDIPVVHKRSQQIPMNGMQQIESLDADMLGDLRDAA